MDRSILYHFRINNENVVGQALTGGSNIDANKIKELLKYKNKPIEVDEEIEDLTLQEDIKNQHEITLSERENRENDRREANERKNIARLEIQQKVENEKKEEADRMDQEYAAKLSSEE